MVHFMDSTRVIYLSHHSVLSGTALNIDQVRNVLRTVNQLWPTPTIEVPSPSFNLVSDEEEFRKVFRSRITELLNLLCNAKSPKDFIRANERTFSSSRLFNNFKSIAVKPMTMCHRLRPQ